MNVFGWVLLGVLLAGSRATAQADPLLHVDAEAGAGYADNLNLATSSSEQAESNFLFAGGNLATAAKSERGTDVFASLGAAGTHYFDYTDLSSVRANARIGLSYDFGSSSWLEISGEGALKGYNDSTRDAIELAGKASLGQRISPLIAWRVEYRFFDHDAEVETFDYQQHRGSVFAVVGPGKADLALGYRLEVAESALYMSLEEARTPKGQGRQRRTPTNSFGEDQIAYRDDTHSHVGVATLSYRPSAWLRFNLSYEIAGVVTSDGTATCQEIAASIRIF